MRIGVFDSGIGGLTVLNELIKHHPDNEYIYYGDSVNIPYGEKDYDFLNGLSKRIINFFLEKRVDLIVIACGTMSSIIDKNKYQIPIVDVISETVKYLNSRTYERVGLIATTRTIETGLFESLLKKSGHKVVSRACPDFVSSIEEDKVDTKDFKVYLKECLSVFSNQNIDILILGCTHYPLIKNHIKAYLNIPLLDMGVVLGKQIQLNDTSIFKLELYFSKIDPLIVSNIQNILKENYDIIEFKV